jgi:LCP family protein required for cell wall assembly
MSDVDAPKRERHRRRSWLQRSLVAVNVGIIGAAVAGVASLGYVYQRVENIERVNVPGLAPQPGETEPVPGDPENFLLVGSDSRAFVDDTGEDGNFGSADDFPVARADTILLVRLDPKAGTAAMLSFPRDLVVDVAGEGPARINTAFEGGPNQLVATIEGTFDVSIDHYVQTDFAAFRDLVNAVGGVELYFEHPVRDWGRPEPGARLTNITGLAVNETGCVTLDGQQALAYVRSRHFEQLIDGEWEPDPTADLGRIRRQQDFVSRVARTALAEGLLDPRTVLDLLDVAEGHLTWDNRLGVNDMVDLARQFRNLDVAAIEHRSLPLEDHPTRRGQLRIADEAEADRVLAVFRGAQPPPPVPGDTAPAEVSVTVLNGSGRSGEASAVRDGLTAAGFAVTSVGERRPFGADRTTVEHPPGQGAAAALVASYLDADIVEVPGADGITVVTGSDFDGVLATPPPAPPAGPTSTTSTTISRQEELARTYAGIAEAECGPGGPS